MADEQRKRERLRLRLPVLLLRAESGTPIWSETADMSNDGFYCTTTQPFSPGERLECLIALPAQQPGSVGSDRFYLEGKVQVIRLVVNKHKGFAIGCRICQYHVVASEAIPSWAIVAELDQPAIRGSRDSNGNG